ncbi:MAG: hypothetical protein KC912_19650 [Proteobacteria bacterium]|nr:hypothetical protein [Pseudomonadota bacterium]
MVLLLLGLTAHAEMWGASQEDLAEQATLIARASLVDGRWASVTVVRGDLAQMPATEEALPDGEWLVICDDVLCPRVIGTPVGDGWVLRGRQPMNGAVVLPGLVSDAELASLGVGEGCLRATTLGQTWQGLFDATGQIRLEGDAQGSVRTSDWGPAVTLSVPRKQSMLTLHGGVERREECWELQVEDTRPPLRDAGDLAHWLTSDAPLPVAEGTLSWQGDRTATVALDVHGRLTLAVDEGEAVPSHGARSMVKAAGTRWMYMVDGESLEVAFPKSSDQAGLRGLLEALEQGPVTLDVYRGDGKLVEGTLTLSAVR